MSARSFISEKVSAAGQLLTLRAEKRRLERQIAAVAVEMEAIKAARSAALARLESIQAGAEAFGYMPPGKDVAEHLQAGAMAVSAGVAATIRCLPISAASIPRAGGSGGNGSGKAAGLTGTARLAASIVIPQQDSGGDFLPS